jgi:DNA polymerase III delta prime subunit
LRATTILERLAGRPEQFPGALLLTGPSEALLATEARRLAARLLCAGTDSDSEASRECRRRVDAGMHPDLLAVLPEGVSIRIDAVREGLIFGAGKPYEAARRVAIVARAELLGPEASNALLKSLEEPGRHFHWILATTHAETLLPTIRSRCVTVPVAPESRSQRVANWVTRGFLEEDAAELAGLEPVSPEEAPALLETHRRWRDDVLTALEEGVARRRIAPLVLLAESLAHAPPERARLLAELLADAAVAAGTSSGPLRHRAVARAIRGLAQRRPPEALRRAALKAADVPADNRRGNKRLHYESVLLGLRED